MSDQKKFRLVTRSDFDGLVCAVLLKHLDLIDEIKFVHPKDMQDGLVAITDEDVTTNLPYVDGVHLAFDHHLSETLRVARHDNHVIDPDAPSAARVVFNYYGGTSVFPEAFDAMMAAVDQGDAARFSRAEILHPTGWPLLNFLMDARTGLGRFHQFKVSNYQLMMDLIDYCRNHGIDEILQLTDVKERVDLYFEQEEKFKEQLRRCSEVRKNAVIVDLRGEDVIYAGNRFMVYALFPECNISIHVLWGLKRRNTVFAIGKSILDRSSKTNIGALALEFEGGGHEAAGTCQISNSKAAVVLEQLIERINADG
ncbi:exopolyphosphatase [Telmatospirillum sp.]|uniref:exopolyphosphatase n=1 Tax=Telmatospirillum sp. TaxID=2079197 RepID=UPI002850A728|nr:exopolyphosphatase [Telmatospirillum sp.]MDR3441084.1 exopolyphosphatase [Telmatospirillum sp.]